MYSLAIELFSLDHEEKLEELSNLEKQVDGYKETFSAKHFERLSKANCSIELGAYFTTIISGLERMGDHIVNIGFSVTNPTGDEKIKYAIKTI